MYWALVQELPPKAEDTLVHHLRRNPEQNKSYAFDTPRHDSKEASLSYRVLLSLERYHLLEIVLHTGRHHQIRAQLARIGCHIRGDLKYGAPRSNPGGGIHLHARSLRFPHPVGGEEITIQAAPPARPPLGRCQACLERFRLIGYTLARRSSMHQHVGFVLNNLSVASGQPAGTVTLDFLRRERGLIGTREGCREGDCGACAVLLGELSGGGVLYRTVNSCLLPLGALQGCHLVTIEGLNPSAPLGTSQPLPPLSPVQECFLDEGASQCGFCTPGFVISLTGCLLRDARPTLAGVLDAVAGNICRCTGYASIRRAVARLLDRIGPGPSPPASGAERTAQLVELGILPPYFLQIPGRLRELARLPGVGAPVVAPTGTPPAGRERRPARRRDPGGRRHGPVRPASRGACGGKPAFPVRGGGPVGHVAGQRPPGDRGLHHDGRAQGPAGAGRYPGSRRRCPAVGRVLADPPAGVGGRATW